MTTRDESPEVAMVPLRDRIWYMQGVRLLLVVVVIAYAIGAHTSLSLYATLAWSAGYLAITSPPLALSRSNRGKVVPIFTGALLLDGVYLAVVTYGSNHFNSPLQYAVAVHVIATTLLGSFRTGLKVALWHSLLVCVTYQLVPISSGDLGGPAKSSAIALVCVLWAVVLATATFASVNERELRHRNLDLQDLAALALALEGTDHPESVGETLVASVADVLRINRVVFVALDEGGHRFEASKGLSFPAASGNPSDDVTIRRALQSRQTLRLTHLLPDGDGWLSSVMPDARNVLVFPMHLESRPVGVLVAEYGLRRSARVERRAVAIVERFVSHAALAFANARLLERISAQAASDGLTGVANRRSLDAAIEREIANTRRHGAPISLILVDLDNFKRLNDEYGHQAGDDALRAVASVIATTSRSGDLVARYGGEEFAILLPATSAATAAQAAERVRAAIAAMPMHTPVTASLGVAMAAGQAAGGADLVRGADVALYEAKRRGRNQVAVASDAADLADAARLTA